MTFSYISVNVCVLHLTDAYSNSPVMFSDILPDNGTEAWLRVRVWPRSGRGGCYGV